MQVSVILLSYNPDVNKLTRTIYGILEQREIDYEIIVSDDGSSDKMFKEIERIF